MTELASLHTRRNQRAVGCFRRIEVTTVLHHVLPGQVADMAGRADRRIRRNNDVVSRNRRIGAIVDGCAEYCSRVDRVESARLVAAFAVVPASRVNEIERVWPIAESADVIGYASCATRNRSIYSRSATKRRNLMAPHRVRYERRSIRRATNGEVQNRTSHRPRTTL